MPGPRGGSPRAALWRSRCCGCRCARRGPRMRATRRRPRATSSPGTSASPPGSRCRSCASTTARFGKPRTTRKAWCATRCSSCTAPTAAASSSTCAEFAGELFGPGQLLDADTVFHRPARRHRPRQVEQAERRPARPFPALRLRRHDASGARLLTDGLGVNHLRLVMGTSMGGMHTWLWGEAVSRFHGRADAARQPADPDLRPQPRVAPPDHRRHQQRPGLAGRGLPHAAALAAHGASR